MTVYRSAALAAALLLLSGCSGIGYYWQLAEGQVSLLAKREPIPRLIAAPGTDEALRARLRQALAARAFASDHLGLPRNGSYTSYADLGRAWVLRNVFATPEFSLAAIEHCFPIAGCVAYRGYYDDAMADAEAARLRALGDDVYVGKVPAYSTLGWFDDPLLNTMMSQSDDEIAAGIFHELAHQKLYVQGDTAFNESLATFVEQEGLRQWRAARGLPPETDPRSRRAEQFTALVLAARERLAALYASGLAPEAMRARKREEIERLRADYRALRDGEWAGYNGYDGWMDSGINNAKLLPFGLYHQWIPAFAALYVRAGGDWPTFYAEARRLGDEKAAPRAAALNQLAQAPEPRP